jgi:hypothetical protein
MKSAGETARSVVCMKSAVETARSVYVKNMSICFGLVNDNGEDIKNLLSTVGTQPS